MSKRAMEATLLIRAANYLDRLAVVVQAAQDNDTETRAIQMTALDLRRKYKREQPQPVGDGA